MEASWMLPGDLLLLLKGSCLAAEMTLILAEEGSSVMMHAPAIKNVNFTEWEYIRDSTPQFILQYYADSQLITVYPAYKARKTSLRVIKPLPQPKLLSSSNLAGSLINLTCMLPQGTVADVSWKKDGHPLPPEKCCRLTWKTTMLQIRKAEKSDCGSYSCIINNSVSWKEAALNLTVTGLTPPARAAQMMTAAALVLAAISAVLFVIRLCQLGKHKLGKEAWEWLMMTILGLLCTSSLLLFAASVIWMQEDGHSAAFILLGLFLVAVIVATALTAVAMAPCRPAVLTHFRSKGWHRVILCITATTLVVNLLFTSLLLRSFHQLHERGCSEAVDLTIGFIIPAVAVLPILLLLFPCFYRNKREKQQQPDTQEATHSLEATSTSVTRCPLQVSPSPVAADPHNVTMNI
uniref:Ig-like domain-containing protein n=1 Tax=Anser cygnoides TaxID=8845 RepID=A0A8B9EED9_ANSCY